VVTNDSAYDLRLLGSRPGDDVLVALGAVGRQSTAGLDELLDLGDRWVLTFRAQGRDGGTIEVNRADLERSGWKLTVPAEVARTLQSAGAPPSP
jgi:hypothetical protein